MDIRRHIIHPGGVWERFSLYLKQGGHAAVHREVARSLRLRTRDVVLDLGGGGHADRKSTRLNSSHMPKSRMPSSA